jgi:methionyl-tRNA synthetase
LEAVQADVLARYARSQGIRVFFNTGTDEHGDKINRTALASEKTASRFAAEMAAEFKRQKKAFSLSYDNFIRTSDKKNHWPGAYKLWNELEKKGDIYKKEYEGLYCVGCEKFLTEKDLVDGECPLHKKAQERVSEENYFFRLTRYAKQLAAVIASGKLAILPETRKNEMLAFIREGLEDVSFSRSRKAVPWGIPIKGSDQTKYVWCDLCPTIVAVGYGGMPPPLRNGGDGLISRVRIF